MHRAPVRSSQDRLRAVRGHTHASSPPKASYTRFAPPSAQYLMLAVCVRRASSACTHGCGLTAERMDDAHAPFFQTVAKTSRRMMGVLMTMRAVSRELGVAAVLVLSESLLPRKGTGFHRFILAEEGRASARWTSPASEARYRKYAFIYRAS